VRRVPEDVPAVAAPGSVSPFVLQGWESLDGRTEPEHDVNGRFEASIETGAPLDIVLDEASARELSLFLTRVRPASDAPVTRRVLAWRDGRRCVVDVSVAAGPDGSWLLAFGDQRDDDLSPDLPEPVDHRLDALATMVWITDNERLARWFNAAWCDFVGAPLADELGWGWMRHVHTDDLVGLLEAYEDGHVGRHGFDHIARLAERDGTFWSVRVRGVPRLVDDRFNGFVGICLPISRAVTAPGQNSPVMDVMPPSDEDTRVVVERLANLEAALQIARPAEAVEAGCLRRLAAAWAAQHPELDRWRDDIGLAVGEATANAVIHGYRAETGVVRLECTLRDGHAEIRIRDWGTWEEPSAARDSRGIRLMQRLCDSFELRHLSEGTEVILAYGLDAAST
jgi:anti-sigma regulatory factor (Ser/Thr protein kinase)/PAS domain-containing protein